MPNQEDTSEVTSSMLSQAANNAFKDAANGRSLNIFNAPTGGEGEAPTVFRYPMDIMLEKTDHLEIKIFESIRDTDVFGIAQFAEGSKTKISKITALKQQTDIFNDPSSQAKLEKNARFIFLPIPQQVSDALSVSYAEDTLNPLQASGLAAANAAMNAKGSDLLKAPEIISGLVSEGGALSKVDSGIQKAIKATLSGYAINALGANVSTASLISRASGQVLQSNLELLFSGVTLRSFPFVYDFTPRNPREAEVVKGIIRTLKQAMTAKGGAPGSRNALFIKSPDVFQLRYKSGDDDHPFLNMFKVCALSDMSVNYTGSGTYATYGDGSPVHIQIQLTFKEINPIYAEDYDDLSERGYTNVGY